MGGVSEEQAAEAAAHQSEGADDKDGAAKDGEGGDNDDAAVGIDVMEEDEDTDQQVSRGLLQA